MNDDNGNQKRKSRCDDNCRPAPHANDPAGFEGVIETVQVANKRLLNLDLLFSRLSCYNGGAVAPHENEV